MEKINIAELLKDCPKGMELDCYLFNGLEFDHIDADNENYPIICRAKDSTGEYYTHTFTKYGEYTFYYDYAKCVIFPKGKTTWDGFVPPCKFKDGDILVHTQNQRFVMSIYHNRLTEFIIKTHCILWDKDEGLSVGMDVCCYPDNTRLATEEEKEKLFDTIKANGYRWNSETKTLKKLINKNKFVVGTTITNGKIISKIVSRDVDSYRLEDGNYVFFNEVHNWELVLDKFDINTLVPFESRVLVRHNRDNKWCGSFFSHVDKDFHSHCYKFVTTSGKSYPMCIPYEGNEHLLGKDGDCDEYFKIWE